MDTKLTIRQILFLFLFLSLSTIFNYIPNIATYHDGGTGYISAIYSGILLFVFAFFLLTIIKKYPNKNFYEILTDLFGTLIAKIIILLYAIWAYLFMLTKIGAYSITLQATLMPSIHPGILITILFLLVIYALTKNERTIFRFSEFLFHPILFFLAIVFLFAIPNINFKEFVPVSINNLGDNLYTVPSICAIGGNLVLVLFFCKHLVFSRPNSYLRKRTYQSVVTFILITIIAIMVSVGINGTETTKQLSYPIFQAFKSVSILNTFERFDAFMTMIIMMSDFVGVFAFLQLTMLCLGWLFNYKKETTQLGLEEGATQSRMMNNCLKVYGVVLFFIACVFILLRDFTQFEFEQYYRGFQTYLNLIFQYILPILLGILCLGKREPKEE